MASLGAVGGTNSIEPVETIIKKQVNNEDTKQQNVVTVAVPKNIQRNIISRERDDRRKLRHRGGGEQKPRNMMMATTSAASVNLTDFLLTIGSLPSFGRLLVLILGSPFAFGSLPVLGSHLQPQRLL